GLLILFSSWGILQESVNVLLESIPKGMDMDLVEHTIGSVPGVLAVHDLHVWTIGSGIIACSCHVTVGEQSIRGGQDVLRVVNAALDAQIESPLLEELIAAGDTVLIVVSDATRATDSAQIINLLVRRLIQNGIQPGDIAIIFATGIHRAVRPDEKVELLTLFITQRIGR